MPLVSLKQILEHAERNNYAVGSFNIVDTTFLDSVMEAAEDNESPIILSMAEVHLPYMNFESLVAATHKIISSSSVPVTLNFDHGLTSRNIKRALDNGFTSVMYDGSNLSFNENVDNTLSIVELAKKYNASVEAELGAVGGSEGGDLEGEVDQNKYTDLEQAINFVEQTKIDALAVAIGNSHGKYKGAPKLDFRRLELINNNLEIPLVLHGGSGLSIKDFKNAISKGIRKINYFTGMSQIALNVIRNATEMDFNHYNDYLNLMGNIKKEIKADVTNQLNIYDSVSRAGNQ